MRWPSTATVSSRLDEDLHPSVKLSSKSIRREFICVCSLPFNDSELSSATTYDFHEVQNVCAINEYYMRGGQQWIVLSETM